MPLAEEWELLGEGKFKITFATADKGADVLHHPRFLIVSLFDEKAAIGDRRRFVGLRWWRFLSLGCRDTQEKNEW